MLKSFIQKKRIFICFIIPLILLFGCGPKSKVANENLSEDKTKSSFDSFTNDMFINEIISNTLNLHYTLSNPETLGIVDYEVTLGNLSEESVETSLEKIKSYQKVLQDFSYENLSKDQGLTYDILDYYFHTELSAQDLTLYREILSPTIGIQAQLPILFAEYSFGNEKDVKNYLILLSQLDGHYEDIVSFQKQKSKEGLFMPDYAVEDIIKQCESFISIPQDNYLRTTFDEKIQTMTELTEEEKDSYKKENLKIISEHVVPAYLLLIEGLNSLKGTGTNDKGLCYYDRGLAYYNYLIRSNTGSSKSVKEMKTMISAKVEGDLEAMAQVVEKNPSILTSINNYNFELNEPVSIMEDLKVKMQKDFPTPPKATYEIKYVSDSLREHLSPAFYLTPTLDNTKDHIIYINPYHQYTKIDLYTTLAHEGYPGHLYQTLYFNSSSPDKVRSLLNFSGFIEGWATYVEMHSYYFAGMDPDLASLLQINNSLTLGIYASIDIGIHFDGWSKEETSNFLSYYGISDAKIVEKIYHAIIEEPTNYLKYYVGYLEILSLKETAENKLGDKFILEDFHKFLLSTGPAPFDIIEKEMIRWIDTQ